MIDFDSLTLKQLFIPGEIYEMKNQKPDKHFFKKYNPKGNIQSKNILENGNN